METEDFDGFEEDDFEGINLEAELKKFHGSIMLPFNMKNAVALLKKERVKCHSYDNAQHLIMGLLKYYSDLEEEEVDDEDETDIEFACLFLAIALGNEFVPIGIEDEDDAIEALEEYRSDILLPFNRDTVLNFMREHEVRIVPNASDKHILQRLEILYQDIPDTDEEEDDSVSDNEVRYDEEAAIEQSVKELRKALSRVMSKHKIRLLSDAQVIEVAAQKL
jgi:hypothetical protein